MDTACAVTFTTICYLLAQRRIHLKFEHRLPYYFKLFIDNILGVWLIDASSFGDPSQDPGWLAFKEELNTCGCTRKSGSALSNHAIFLHLDIT
jgi:hypothetical protein